MENKAENTGTITIRKDAVWKYATFILLAVLILGAIVYMLPDTPTGNVVNNNQGQQLPSRVEASVGDDAILGDPNAPVTIIEFSDYQCPFCQRFWSDTLPLIKSEYIDTGKVNFVYRDFPLSSIHPMAQPAAEAQTLS